MSTDAIHCDQTLPGAGTTIDPDAYDGWQALAIASIDRLLTDAELAAAECLPVEIALDLLFPTLGDAARHETLWALG